MVIIANYNLLFRPLGATFFHINGQLNAPCTRFVLFVECTRVCNSIGHQLEGISYVLYSFFHAFSFFIVLILYVRDFFCVLASTRKCAVAFLHRKIKAIDYDIESESVGLCALCTGHFSIVWT